MTARGPGQRAGLQRPAVLAAARELVAEAGADALTMRALARRLDVAPNALYSHVADKTDLVDSVLDDLLGAVAAPDADADDSTLALVDLMSSTYTVLVAQPDLLPLYLTRQGARGPNAVRLGVAMDTLLTRAGVGSATVDEARTALIVHTIGCAAYAGGAAPGSGGRSSDRDSRSAFVQSLRWLLTGIAYG